MKILKNYEMNSWSNMKIGGIAENYFIVENREDLIEINQKYEKLFILGNGTNTLIGDGKLKTNFVSLEKLNKIEKIEKNIIKVEAGVDFSGLISYNKRNNYKGLENLAGIPGSLGGLVYMNGGSYGSEIFDCLISVEILDEKNKISEIKKEDLRYSYRKTEIQEKEWIILSATFLFEEGFDEAKVKELNIKRHQNHPLDLPNLGSSFKNPEGKHAVKLILEAGLMGYTVGKAQLSTKHANFIVNLGGATFNDVITLIEHVKLEVKKKTGISLEEEIVIIND
jgi:UDP-N-acetylmuramate dehydrogenase